MSEQLVTSDGTVSVKVSPQVKAQLDSIKSDEGHKSLDSVLRTLLLYRAIIARLYPKGVTDVRMNTFLRDLLRKQE